MREPMASFPPIWLSPCTTLWQRSRMVGRALNLAGILLVTFATTALARVGETSAECELRYGKGNDLELKVGPGLEDAARNWTARVYSARGLTIEIVFEKDRAIFIRYSNQPVLSLGTYERAPHGLTQKEIEYLKRVNAGAGARWIRYKDPILEEFAPTVTVWKTPDSLYFSGYDREGNRLFVCDSNFWDTVMAQVRKKVTASDRSDSAERLEGL